MLMLNLPQGSGVNEARKESEKEMTTATGVTTEFPKYSSTAAVKAISSYMGTHE